MADIGTRQGAPQLERWMWLLRCIFVGAAVSVAGSFLFSILVEVNFRLLPTFPWLLLLLAVVPVFALPIPSGSRPTHQVGQGETLRAASVSLVLGISLGLIAAALTGVSEIGSGEVRLPGERSQATQIFRASAVLATIIAAGLLEEIGTRKFIQFRLARHWPPYVCEASAGLVFVALHFFRVVTFEMLLFICLLAFVCGRAAAKTKSLWAPICIHVVANLTVALLVWFGRSLQT